MRLKTKRTICSCGGTITHIGSSSQITIYTQQGPIETEHLESHCWKYSKGYYSGYTSEAGVDHTDYESRKFFKYYEEDCLEAEGIKDLFNHLITYFQFLITTSRTVFSVRYLYEMSLNILYLHGSFRYSRVG